MRIVCSLLMLLLSGAGCQQAPEGPDESTVAAARAALEAESARNDFRDEMTRVLGLDAGASSAIGDTLVERDEAFVAWLDSDKGQRLFELEARIAEAARSQDLDGLRKATAEGKPLRQEVIGLLASYEEKVLDLLAPEQRMQWYGHEVTRKMLELMEPLNLDAQQIVAIQGSGAAAVSQAIDGGEPNPKAAAFLALEAWVEGNVLLEAQGSQYQAIKDENKMRSLSL